MALPACAALLLAAPPLRAAEPAPPAEKAAPVAEAEEPEPVPLAQVAGAAEEAERLVRELVALSAPVPEVAQVETDLAELGPQLGERQRRARSLAQDPVSLPALDEELKSWELSRDQLAAARAALTARLTALEGALEDLSARRKAWKGTEEAALKAAAPEAVVNRIREVRQRLRDAKRALDQRRDELLALQTQVADVEKRAQEMFRLLSEARSSLRSLIFLRDSPPLWRSATDAGRPPLLEDVGAALRVRGKSLDRFVRLRWERMIGQALLLVLAAMAALALRQRAHAWRADDPRLEASAVVFERPYSAAWLVALLATPLFYARAPAVVTNLTTLALIVPIVRLLPRLLEPALVPAVYALAGLAAVDQLRDVLETRVFAVRVLLLIESAAAAGFVHWMLRPARLAGLPAGTRIPRSVGRLLRTAFLLLGVAVVANVLGWVRLSRVLADGVLGSAYLGVVLYGGARVVRAALRGLLRSEGARRIGVLRHHGPRIAEWIRRGVGVAALGVWAFGTLVTFGLEEEALAGLGAVLSAEASFGSVAVSLGDVLAFLLTLLGSFLLARLLRSLLEDDVVPRLPLGRGVGNAITATAQYAILGVGFLLAVSAAGVDLNQFSLLAGALGVGVGFGLQNIVNNFVSGLILLYERPVQVGDMVEVGGVLGEVRRIGIRSSTVRTFQGAEVIVPNGTLISDQVVNWTLSDRRRRVDVKVGVAYGTDPERVIELLVGVARAHPEVLDEPGPRALFLGFGDSSLDFELRCWTALFDSFMLVQSQLAVGVNRALAEADITIPFPQRDLHFKTGEPELMRALRGGGE